MLCPCSEQITNITHLYCGIIICLLLNLVLYVAVTSIDLQDFLYSFSFDCQTDWATVSSPVHMFYMRDHFLLNKLLFCFFGDTFLLVWFLAVLCTVLCSVEQPVHTDCHFCATHVYVILVCGVALLPSVLVMQQPARVRGKSLLHIVEGRGNVFGLNYLWLHNMGDSIMPFLQFNRGV